jgi:hypothetical protein
LKSSAHEQSSNDAFSFADFNGNGALDIFVAGRDNSGKGIISLLFN